MSLFSWFSAARKRRRDAQASVLVSSGFSRMEPTKPVGGAHHPAPAQSGHAQRKHERMAHREQLYAVVREAMVRAGVLTSNYKFKVLSLDAQGRQYMVMVDLSHGAVHDTQRAAEIEAMIAQSARSRHDIIVTAVYWRASEHVAVGDPQPRMPAVSQPAPLAADVPPPRRTHSRPAPLEAAVSRPAAMDPLQADEVAAFRKALDAGVRGERALAAAGTGRPPQNYTLLTGFEDTEMVSDAPGQHLSTSQYGALR